MAIFASTTLGSSDPSRAMSIKALEARAQALAAAQSKQEMPTSLPSPWQGAALVANQAADAFATKRADQAAAARRQDLAGYMANLGDNPTMAQVAPIMAADQETGRTILQEIQQRRQQATALQAQKELAVQKAQQDKEFLAEQDRIKQAQPTDLPLVQLKRALDRGEISQEDYEAGKKKLTSPPAAEQKLVSEKQSENIDLQSTAASLAEAAELLKSGKVYSGGSASFKGAVGPYTSALGVGGGITGTDPEHTKASERYNQIMNAEVLPILSKLKGATSDKDMQWAITTVNNPNANLETKQRALDVLRAKMGAHLQASEQSLTSLGGKPVKVDIPPSAGGAGAVPAAPSAGGDPLEKARAAIAAGAPRDKVIERLKAAGIDASGL